MGLDAILLFSLSLAPSGDARRITTIRAPFPCVCKDGNYEIVQGLDIDDFSRAKIDATAGELVEERDAVKDLGLI